MTRHRCDIKGFRNTLDAFLKHSLEKFFSFYHENEEYEKGRTIWKDEVQPFLHHVKNFDVSIAIGYGAGGEVFYAGKVFQKTMGIDIHEFPHVVGNQLAKAGCENYQLMVVNGYDLPIIPLEDNTVDLVYSWTVFMHMGKAKNVLAYLTDIHRILKPEGIAIIYFAGQKHDDPEEVLEIPNRPVNTINILIKEDWMRKQCSLIGFDIMDVFVSEHYIHHIIDFHGQHGIILKK